MVTISLEARWFGCKRTVNLSFFIDIFFFHVHSIVSFFSKLVIPVHVSMEEPVFKTKVEKSTTVNVLVDGKGTIANKSLQVPTKYQETFLLIHLWLVRKPSDFHRHLLSSKYHALALNSKFWKDVG